MLVFVCSLRNLLRWAYLSVYGASNGSQAQLASGRPEDLLADVRDEATEFTKRKLARSAKAYNALQDEDVKTRSIIWLTPASVVMHIHYSLFDSGL
jgi:hypothetical protein